MSTIKNDDQKYIANTYARFDVVFKNGNGSMLYDENGKEYIDLGSGIAVNSFGVNDQIFKDAVFNQLNSLQHASNLYFTEPQTKLAKMLCEKTGFEKVFFSNSGAEANECAIKVARKYFSDNNDGNAGYIITLKNSFHGRTITTLSATGQDVFHTHFGPFTDGFLFAEANNFKSVKELFNNKKIAAVMFEVIQGEGGVCPLDKNFVNQVCNLARENDSLIIVDEVQTGNGRTGKYFCFEHFGFMPDVVSTAKGIAGGLPLGATLLGDKVAGTFAPSTHGSTFGGNPISCAAACSIVERIDEALMADVLEKETLIRKILTSSTNVKSITGMGLMLGIETTKPAKDIVVKCLEKGVVVLTAKDKVRLLPALNIGKDELEKAINILKEVIEE